MREHTVEQGDCLWSISMATGHFWKTIWDDSSNADLKQKRKDPNVLAAGDVVHIPDLRLKTESGATEKRHRFHRKGIPVKFRLRLLHLGEPRKNENYKLDLDGQVKDGQTDGDGWIEVSIPPDATRGRLLIGDEIYELKLGRLDPVDMTTGVQQRLQNLGLYGGPIDGQESPLTTGAIANFQKRQGLSATGQMDDTTRKSLLTAHAT